MSTLVYDDCIVALQMYFVRACTAESLLDIFLCRDLVFTGCKSPKLHRIVDCDVKSALGKLRDFHSSLYQLIGLMAYGDSFSVCVVDSVYITLAVGY